MVSSVNVKRKIKRSTKPRVTSGKISKSSSESSGPPISKPDLLPAPKLKKVSAKHPPTEQQSAAITAALELKPSEGLAVIANAGCGKTELASEIVAALVKRYDDPDIIITSFTTKAVGELKDRLPRSNRTRVKTFSALCLDVLRSSGYEVDIEVKSENKNSRKTQTKSTKISQKISGTLATSEVINAQYLRAINFGGWEIRQYAEGATQRNGYHPRKKTVDPAAIKETEASLDKKISIIDDPGNRRRFVECIRPVLTDHILNWLVENGIHPDIGLDETEIEIIQNELSNQNISFQLGKDTSQLVDFLCDYTTRLNPVDANDPNYQIYWEGQTEYYDMWLEDKGVYSVIEPLLSAETFDDLPMCAGSILADEQVQIFLATDPTVNALINIKKANDNIYATIALLSELYITQGLEQAKKEGIFTYNELMLCCMAFPVTPIWPRYILIDEAQDLSPLQHKLLKRFVSVGTSLIIIGDPNQSIFEWAGAASDSYAKLIGQFNCKVLPLSQSFRCGKNIIEYAQNYVLDIECGNERLGLITEIDNWMFQGQYLNGDLVLARTRLDVTRAYFNFMRGNNNPNEGAIGSEEADVATEAYASGLNLTQAIREVTKRCKSDGKSVEDLWFYVNTEINSMYQRIKEGSNSSAGREIFEKMMMVKMMFQSLQVSDPLGKLPVFYSDDEFIKVIDKKFPSYAKPPADEDCVRFLTVHKAKGSEADRCIVIDAPRFAPPSVDPFDTELTEEQRLSYVMITRAKNELILCGGKPAGESAQSRTGNRANQDEEEEEKSESFFGEPEVPENAHIYRVCNYKF